MLRYNITFPTYLGAQYDAATTNLSYVIPGHTEKEGAVELNVSFLTPITPTSTLRQSIPAGYIVVYVKGTFDVNIYIEVNGQWVSGDRDSQIVWDLACSPAEQANQSRPLLKTWKVKRDGATSD